MKNILQDVHSFKFTHSVNQKNEEEHIKSKGSFFLYSTKITSVFFRLTEP